MKRTLVLMALLLAPTVSAQVRVVPDGLAFGQRIAWATETARSSGWSEYWLGISAIRTMRAGSHFGNWGGGTRPLGDLLADASGDRPDLQQAIRRELDRTDGARGHEMLVDREIAVLVRLRGGEVRDVNLVDLESSARLEGLPVLWTGVASGPEPVAWLSERYRGATDGQREDLVGAVAVQEETRAVAAFLRRELREASSSDVREAAAFWIADRLGDEATPDLERTVRTDRSEDVREAAVWALSNVDSDEARRIVVRTAGDRDMPPDVREAARFALVRWAQERSGVGASDDDSDVEIQKTALYALADLDESGSTGFLVRTAREHRSADVRRAALYMLADMDSDAALDALIELSGVR